MRPPDGPHPSKTETPRQRLEYAAACLAATHATLSWVDALGVLTDALDMTPEEIHALSGGEFADLWHEALGDQAWQDEVRGLGADGDTRAAQAQARHRYLEGLPTDRVRRRPE
jgi:hypothetical protein